MINTWEYRNYNNFWYQLLFILRHPIEFVTTFKDNMYNWPDPANTIRKYWMKLYTRLPFQKPCRWLGSMLVERIYDNKVLDNFECRTRGKITKYYRASCAFGKVKFWETTYTRNGKTVNTFMDVFVTTLVDQEKGKKNAESIKTTKKLIYSGWVFTRKKAERIFKEVVKKNLKLYKGEGKNYPAAACPWWVELSDNMTAILKTGKFKDWNDLTAGNVVLEETFNKTKDNIVKLWCYVTYLLTCANDFDAHTEMADIESTCSYYMFVQARKKDPKVDNFYLNLIQENKVKQAEVYLKTIKKDEKNIKKETITNLENKIKILKDKYLNMPYEYYRI